MVCRANRHYGAKFRQSWSVHDGTIVIIQYLIAEIWYADVSLFFGSREPIKFLNCKNPRWWQSQYIKKCFIKSKMTINHHCKNEKSPFIILNILHM